MLGGDKMDSLLLIIIISVLTAVIARLLLQYISTNQKVLTEADNNYEVRCDERDSTEESRKERKDVIEEKDDEVGVTEDVGTVGKSEKKQEMTMKEKFYLFLEKGFCPELEQGVQDPIYKRHGGKMKLHNKPGIDPSAMFCPFAEEEGDTEQEVMTIEKLMTMGMRSGGKCPFMFEEKPSESTDTVPSSPHKTEDTTPGNSGVECPFKFGLNSHADSEDEADVPKGHGQNGNCPLTHAGDIETDPDSSLDNSMNQSKYRLKEALKSMKTNMSKEELDQEEAIRIKQMNTIMKLLAAQEKKESAAEVQSQLKMYM